jgi:protein TonB
VTAQTSPRELSLRRPIAVSATVHVAVAAVLFLTRTPARPALPPTYRVSLIAAPAGPRAVGIVQPAAAAPAPAPTPAHTPPSPAARSVPPTIGLKAPAKGRMPPPARRATPSAGLKGAPSVAPAPKAAPAAAARAGGGPTGGKGADVANVQVDGIAFPYPGYLENVVRQIALRFKPPGGGALQAVVAFLIRRDGSVAGIRLTTRSGVYSFDTEAMGAVDAAAQARAFGPLPQGFSDDALPVIFSFDPRLIR